MTRIAIIGLGEAGRLYAAGLAGAHAEVRGFDPYQDTRTTPGTVVDQRDSLADAIDGADVVLSLVGASAAIEVATGTIPLLGAQTIYADLNTTAPEVKQQIAQRAERAGVRMADVAVLAPVPRDGHLTDLLASGEGAEGFVALMAPFGMPLTVVPGAAGEAARMKLLRSIFMKGLAALVIESLGAARVSGSEGWLRDRIAQELGEGGAALVERLISGSYEHAPRREQEVRASLAELEASGQPADMTRATLAWFERILAERD
ncbi:MULTISPECIES: NAD(P)-binding domain-containing protein [Bacteria]